MQHLANSLRVLIEFHQSITNKNSRTIFSGDQWSPVLLKLCRCPIRAMLMIFDRKIHDHCQLESLDMPVQACDSIRIVDVVNIYNIR